MQVIPLGPDSYFHGRRWGITKLAYEKGVAPSITPLHTLK